MRCFALLCSLLLSACSSAPRSESADALRQHPPSGFLEVEGGRVWYEIHGSGGGTPLLVLHGGPGLPHDYLVNLAELGDGRPVVFYDQLGCGRSDRPQDEALWTRERFVRELAQVRRALGLREVVLYGHSWGAMLAVDYLSGRGGVAPGGVRGVILAGPVLSIPRWMADARQLIEALPEEHRTALQEGERTGQRDGEAYRRAIAEFHRRHVCRVEPMPPGLAEAFAGMGAEVYAALNGPNDFEITGPLRTADVTSELAAIDVPVLFLCGQHDHATPATTFAYAEATADATAVVIGGAAHLANGERPQVYLEALRSWLDGQRF